MINIIFGNFLITKTDERAKRKTRHKGLNTAGTAWPCFFLVFGYLDRPSAASLPRLLFFLSLTLILAKIIDI